MKITTISEALHSMGDQIPCVSGTLVQLWDFKTGTGKKPWKLQAGMLRDSTGDIKILFSGREEIPAKWKGSKITILASEKSGKGIVCEEDKYEGKITPQIKVTDCAMIDFGTTPAPEQRQERTAPRTSVAPPPPGEMDEEAQAQALLDDAKKRKALRLQAEAAAKAQEQANAANTPPAQNSTAGVPKTKRRLMQLANLYRLCLDASKWIAEAENMSPEDIRAMATFLGIQATRENLQGEMPTTPLTPIPKPAPPDLHEKEQEWDADPTAQSHPSETIDQEAPATWQEVICHVPPFEGKPLGTLDEQDLQALFDTFKPKPSPGTKALSTRDQILLLGIIAWKKSTKVAA